MMYGYETWKENKSLASKNARKAESDRAVDIRNFSAN